MDFLNFGGQADIYRYKNQIVKQFRKHDDLNEVQLALYIKSINNNQFMLPEYFWAGIVDGLPVVVREELKDYIVHADSDEEYNALIQMDSHLNHSVYLYYLISEITKENILSIAHNDYNEEDLFKEVYSELNRYKLHNILPDSYIHNFCETARQLYNHGCIISDAGLRNLGIDKNNNIKIRDPGAFIIKNPEIKNISIPVVDSFQDVFNPKTIFKQKSALNVFSIK